MFETKSVIRFLRQLCIGLASGACDAAIAAAAWHVRRSALARWLQAGPAALVLAVLTMAAMPLILPTSPGSVDNLVVPVVIFPLIWSALIIWPVAASRPSRVSTCFAALATLDTGAIAFAFLA